MSPARHVLRGAIIVNTTWHVNNRGDESAAAPHAGDRPVRARNWQDDCGHILVGPVHGLQRATVLCGPYSLCLTQGYASALNGSMHITTVKVRNELAGRDKPYGGLLYLVGLKRLYRQHQKFVSSKVQSKAFLWTLSIEEQGHFLQVASPPKLR